MDELAGYTLVSIVAAHPSLLPPVHMKKLNFISLVLLQFFIANLAMAKNTNQCAFIAARLKSQFMDISSCKCRAQTSQLKSLPKLDDELEPLAVCGYHRYANENRGDYFYQMNLLVSGLLTIDLNSDDFSYTFLADQSHAGKLPRFDTNLRFADESEFAQRFAPPSKDKDKACWQARASIRINNLRVNSLNGQDEDGTYLETYKILKLDKYQTCKKSVS